MLFRNRAESIGILIVAHRHLGRGQRSNRWGRLCIKTLPVPRSSVNLSVFVVDMTAKCVSRTHQPGLRSGLCDADRIRSISELDIVLVIALHNLAETRRKHPYSLDHPLARLPLCVNLFGIGQWVG